MLLVAGVVAVMAPTPPLLAQDPADAAPAFASGITEVRRARIDQRFDRTLHMARRTILIDPTLELDLPERFDITHGTQIFVTRLSFSRFDHLGLPLRVERNVDEDTFTVEVIGGSAADAISWLVIRGDGLQGPPGFACWDANRSRGGEAAEDVNGDGVVDVADCTGAPGPAGEPGEPGSPGVPCWDVDRDGVGDPQEDTNHDTAFDASDCEGPPGETGEQGEQGEPGEVGVRGPACWDVDEDFVDDAGEDVTGDGQFNTDDCAGPEGPAGPAGEQGEPGPDGPIGEAGTDCWDLDGNGADDSAEDVDGNGVFDTRDCQGPAGPVGETGPAGPPGGSVLEDFTCGAGDAVIGFDASGFPVCGRGDDTHLITGFTATMIGDGYHDAYELTFTDDTQVRIATGPLTGTGTAIHFLTDPDGELVAECREVFDPLDVVPAGDYVYFVVVDKDTDYGRVYTVAFLGGEVLLEPGTQRADDVPRIPQEADAC